MAMNGKVPKMECAIERAEGRVEIGELPVAEIDPDQIRRLFQNLMGAVTRWGTKAVGWVEALRNPTGAPTNVGFRKASTQPTAQVHPYFTGYCHVKGGGFHCPPTSNCARWTTN